MPFWRIIEDKQYTEFTWSQMNPAQESDPHPEYKYHWDDTDRMIYPIDMSQYDISHPQDSVKLMRFPSKPYNLPWTERECIVASQKWSMLEAYPIAYYNFVHVFEDIKNRIRANPECLNVPLPTLWAYYETLPEWCRENQAVKSLMFAFEVCYLVIICVVQ